MTSDKGQMFYHTASNSRHFVSTCIDLKGFEEFFILFSLILPVDNAYDPDVNAKQIWIDKTQINNKGKDIECLTFRDDGNGLSHILMYQMLR